MGGLTPASELGGTVVRWGTGMLAQVKPPSTTPLPNPASSAVEDLTDLSKACDAHSSWLCQRVYEATGSAWLAGLTEWLVAKPLRAVLILAVAFVVNRLARSLIKRFMEHRLRTEPGRLRTRLREKTPNVLLRTGESNLRAEARAQTLSVVLRSMASVIIWFTAGIAVLEVFEVNLGPLVATAGVVGVALGFGAQNVVRDFLAGFFLVSEDQFGVGDIVDLSPEVRGTVESVTLRATRVRDVNGVLWHVPNGQIQRVGNKSQEWARALLDVPVAYGADLDQVQELLMRTAESLASDPAWRSEILAAPEVWGVEAFTDTGVTIRMVLKTQPASQFGVLRELRARVKEALDEAGLVMPAGGRSEVWIHDAASVEPVPPPAPSSPRRPSPPDGTHPRRGDAAETG